MVPTFPSRVACRSSKTRVSPFEYVIPSSVVWESVSRVYVPAGQILSGSPGDHRPSVMSAHLFHEDSLAGETPSRREQESTDPGPSSPEKWRSDGANRRSLRGRSALGELRERKNQPLAVASRDGLLSVHPVTIS